MPISRLQASLAALALLLTIVACILPGQPAPEAGPDAINTIVAETFSAAVAQTANAAPVIPTSTQDGPPLPIETPLSGSTPEMTGAIIEQIQDGTTKYTDYDGDFEVVFPEGWLVVRPNSDEFNAALADSDANNQGLHDQMALDQADYDAEFDRLYSYPIRPDLEEDTVFGFSKLTWDSEDTNLLDNEAMGELIRGLESSGALPGFRVDVSQMYENRNEVFLIEIGGRFTINDGQGGFIPFYSTIVFFKPTPNSISRITATYLQDYQLEILADVKSVIDSIRLISPPDLKFLAAYNFRELFKII